MSFLNLKRKPTTSGGGQSGGNAAQNSTSNGAGPSGTAGDAGKKEWYDQEPGERFFGFENFGNTCYANSVLQALYFSRPFRQLVESYNPPRAQLKKRVDEHEGGASLSPRLSQMSAPPTVTAASGRPQSSGSATTAPPLIPPSSLRKAAQTRPSSSGLPGYPKRQNSTTSNDEGGAALGPKSSFQGVAPPQANTITVADEATGPTTLLTTLHDLFVAISKQPKNYGTVAPQAFINQLKRDNEFFRSTLHQDAHEFLNYLINMVAESVEKEEREKRLLAPRPHHTSTKTWVHKLFEGVLTNETRCLTCETISSRDEAFLDLSIDIEPNSSVTSCLRQFSANEMLCQRNKFSCDRCCGLQEAEKRMKIKRLPNILALHLKRFKYEEQLQRHVKLTYRVVFPFELRLFNTTDSISNPDRLYRLWAIVVHIGIGPTHGHYITIVKSGSRWIVFDDNTVYPIEQSDISKFFGDTPGSGSGYVLFYEADDVDFYDLHIDPFKARTDPEPVKQLAKLDEPVIGPTTQQVAAPEPSSSANGLGLNIDDVARPDTAASSDIDTSNDASTSGSARRLSMVGLGSRKEDGNGGGWGLKRGVAKIGRSLSLNTSGAPQSQPPTQQSSAAASPVITNPNGSLAARRPSSSASASGPPLLGQRASPSEDGSASTSSVAHPRARRESRASADFAANPNGSVTNSPTLNVGNGSVGPATNAAPTGAFAATRGLFSRKARSSAPPAMSPVHDHLALNGTANGNEAEGAAFGGGGATSSDGRATAAFETTSDSASNDGGRPVGRVPTLSKKEADKLAKEQRKAKEKEDSRRAKEEAKRLKEEQKAEKLRRKMSTRS